MLLVSLALTAAVNSGYAKDSDQDAKRDDDGDSRAF